MKNEKLFVALLIGFLLTFFTGCFDEKQSDSARGVELQRDGNAVSVFAKTDMEGATVTITGATVKEEDIIVGNDSLSVTKNQNGKTFVSIARTTKTISAGEKLFTLNSTEKVNVELKAEDIVTLQELNKVKGNILKKGTSANLLLGDFNADGKVDLVDFSLFKDKYAEIAKYLVSYDIAPAAFGTGVWSAIYSSASPDGAVDIIDFVIFAKNYGKINPVVEATSVSIDQGASLEIAVAGTTNLSATVLPSNANDLTVTWTSQNSSIASVNANGVVTGVAEGTTTITATTANGKTDTISITIKANIVKVTDVTINPITTPIKVGDIINLTAVVKPDNATNKTVTWSVTPSNLASINQNGVLTCIGAGTVTVSATADGVTKTLVLTISAVEVLVDSVSIVEGNKTLNVADTATYTATVLPSNATNKTVTWTSGTTSVATVDSATGKVTAVAKGTSIITATAGGKSGTVTVTVQENNSYPTTLGDMHPASGAFSPVSQSGWGSAAYKLGPVFNGSDLEIGLFSANATKVLLEIYDTAFGADAKYDYWMTKGSDNIWRAKISSVPANTFYAFRVWGPNWTYNASWTRGNSNAGYVSDVDTNGNRFNPNKVVYDPYSKELSHDDESVKLMDAGYDGQIYASGAVLYKTKPRREWDTGKYVPKGIVVKDSTSIGTKPAIPKNKAMIYESHVRALSKSDSTANLSTILGGMTEFAGITDLAADERGTYIGAGKMAKYMKGLGFNAIEFMPVHECFNNELNDYKPNSNEIVGAENFWGYMTANFFAPERRYAKDQSPGGPTREFKEMVKMFHDEGIEVYLDVVYNHTGEGGLWSDTDNNTAKVVSFRGIDNSAYYQLLNANQTYQNDSGCGNNFAGASSSVAGNLVKDSLRYWIDEMGVDGFRYDLAPVLGRDARNTQGWFAFNGNAQLLKDIDAIATEKNVEMIAEAWDIGAYVLTGFPGNWSDWNGKFRDNIRSAVNGGIWGSLGDIMQGSGPLGYNTAIPESVNFVTAHDGMTMMDVVSYDNGNYAQTKRQTAGGVTYYASNANMSLSYPFGPSDGGSSDNGSSSNGGDQAVRRAKLRNFWTIEFLSKGIPMALYGDEFGRTQNGNNNTYNVDSPATWANYTMINTDSPNKVAITGGTYHDNFGTDTKVDSKNGLFLFVKDLIKLRRDNDVLTNPATTFTNWAPAQGDTTWSNTGSFTIGDKFHVMVNMSGSSKTFTIPAGSWKRIIDTGAWAEKDGNIWSFATATAVSGTYDAAGNNVVVLQK